MKALFTITLALAITLSAGLIAADETETPDSAQDLIRQPEPDVDRIPQGMPRDPARSPDTAIYPWDRSGVDGWIAAKIAALGPLVSSDQIREMALDQILRERGGRLGLYFQVTYDALDLLWYGEEQDQIDGLYVILHKAAAGDAYAAYNLAGHYEGQPGLDPSAPVADLYRLAADRDMLPAIINLANIWRSQSIAAPDEIEAYLRYGLDLDASDGGLNIIDYAYNFYVFDQPDRDPGGYLRIVRERYAAFGELRLALWSDATMYGTGRDAQIDLERAHRALMELVQMGDVQAMTGAGYNMINENGAVYDRDLVRDILVACLQRSDRAAGCALNLGSLYTQFARDSVDLPLAVALYRYAVELDPVRGEIARREVDRFSADLTRSELELSQTYFAAIQGGDFSDLPHIRDAQPIPSPN